MVRCRVFNKGFFFCVLFQLFLANEEIGDSLDEVESLITKHKNFEKSLTAQEEKFKVRHSLWLIAVSLYVVVCS